MRKSYKVMSFTDKENLFKQLISSIGEDPSRQGLRFTPKRAANAFDFLTKGYTTDIHSVINLSLIHI